MATPTTYILQAGRSSSYASTVTLSLQRSLNTSRQIRGLGMVRRNRYSLSQLLSVCSAYIYDQKRSSRRDSISMRSKNTPSSLVGKKFTLLITVRGMSTRDLNLLSPYLSDELRLPEYFEHRNVRVLSFSHPTSPTIALFLDS